jgi:methyl-accepting chemotaxis protein
MVVLAAIGITELGAVNEGIDKIVKDCNVKTALANDMIDDINVVARAVRNVVLLTDNGLRSEEKQRIAEARGRYREAYENLSKRVRSDRGKEILASVQKLEEVVNPLVDRVVALGVENKVEQATQILTNELRSPQRKLLETIDALIHYQNEITQKTAEQSTASYANARALLISISALAILVGLSIAFFLTRGVTRSLNRVIAGLTGSVEQVISASVQVAGSSQSLAEGASEQAAAIEETSSSLEEISSMTKQNAQNAGQADALMKDTGEVMSQANDSMKELTLSMEEITRASEDTSKIIKSIDEIAFQTNLLALNAAVEAARAGEAGAGFAVVADEVRNLAMRAADAARNTANLIEKTVKKVKNGAGLVSKTSDAFGRMANTASNITELVAEIAVASKEQSQGIDQVNRAVSEMDKVVQQNAANAEENAAASEEMNAQAVQVQELIASLAALLDGNGRKQSTIMGMGKEQIHATVSPSRQGRLPFSSGAGRGKEHETALILSKAGPREAKPVQVIHLDDERYNDF